MRLKDKVAVITGAGSGIGAAAARVFASEGAKVVAADMAEKNVEEVVRGIREKGGEAAALKCDVRKSEDARAIVAEAVKRYGGLDILYANAAVCPGISLLDTTEEEWDRIIDTNLKGVFLCCKAAIPELKKRGGGAILATASVNGLTTEPNLAAYCASKGGVIMLMKSVAIDHGQDNIRANAILPGWVDTAMTRDFLADPGNRKRVSAFQPAGRVGQPEEIARVAAFMVSDEASFMTGSAVIVDGGLISVLSGHSFPVKI